MPITDFDRHPLLFGPSPVHPLERLTHHLGGATLWAKREDCNSGVAYGGNKTRKLEYLVADALARGCDTLVSIGGVQSNHTPARSPRSPPAPGCAACWCRRAGSTGPTPSTTRSATS
ncbi:1-aminocyclopropane-1-carboxylate deaminase/D-cysteine desulfhydrase-like pyridoxal-dependent ACC family enzyme [Streptomyces filamentosus]